MTSHDPLQDPRLRDPASPDADLFTFDYLALDDPDEDQRFTRYWDLEPLMRGPQPVPDWLVTDRAAIETDLGVLKTGKEADVFLLERSVPATSESVVLAAKRYRGSDHRNFQRNDGYTQGRRTKDSREARAMARGSAFGKAVAAGQWAMAEWDSLRRCYEWGLPVPYPVQIDGTEILMELVAADDGPAPRLATTRPDPDLLAEWFEQLRSAMVTLAVNKVAHGDLSPYNILTAGERLVIIDLPQMVDIVANPNGVDFLLRDCRNVCTWFVRRGLDVDAEDLFGELMASAW